MDTTSPGPTRRVTERMRIPPVGAALLRQPPPLEIRFLNVRGDAGLVVGHPVEQHRLRFRGEGPEQPIACREDVAAIREINDECTVVDLGEHFRWSRRVRVLLQQLRSLTVTVRLTGFVSLRLLLEQIELVRQEIFAEV